MRKKDQRDYTAIALMLLVVVLIYLLFVKAVKADTTLTYTVCTINGTCVSDRLYGDDADFFNCIKQGPQIVIVDMERKSRIGYYLKKWVCALGPRSEDL